MLNFLTIESESFGLDISDFSLKVVRFRKKGKFFTPLKTPFSSSSKSSAGLTLASWGEIPVKPGVIEGGEIKNEETFVEIIKKGLDKIKGEKLKSKNVVVSLPENKAFFQVIKMPKMSEEELREAVPFEAENYIPMSAKDVYFDFEIIPGHYENSESLNILVVAVPRKVVDSYLSCLKKSGLVVQAFEVESQAIARAVIKNKISPFPVLMIDFGKSMTSLIFFAGYSIRFTCSIPISSFNITEAIAETLKIDLIRAEKLKIEYGLKINKELGEENEKIFEAAKSVLVDLVGQAKKYIIYYQTHISKMSSLFKDGKIEKVILCGGGANLKGFTDFLYSELKIPVELGNPWINILPEPLREVPKMPYEESLGYTTALGLALRGTKR